MPKYKLNETILFATPKGTRVAKIISIFFPTEAPEWVYGVEYTIFVQDENSGRQKPVLSHYILGESEIIPLTISV